MDELKASQERYRALVELSPDAILVIKGKRFLFANQQALRLVGGHSLGQLRSRSALELVPPSAQQPMIKRFEQARPGVSACPYIEGQLMRLDGGSTPVETAAASIEYEGDRAILLVVRDITARHSSEQAMWAAEAAVFRRVPRKHRSPCCSSTRAGVVVDANPRAR